MKAATRFKLHKIYNPPLYRYGARVKDLIRGEVIIVRTSNGRIPWPIAKVPEGRARQMVIYGGLARALQRESMIAVAHWWGVTQQTVTAWRRKLGITGQVTKGSDQLKREYAKEPFFKKAQKKAWSKARDPVRRQKIAAAKLGVPRPKTVVAKMRKAKLGKTASDVTRRKMSESHKRRGTRPPSAGPAWLAWEDALLDKVLTVDVAARTGRTVNAVRLRRRKLGLPDGRRQRHVLSSLANPRGHCC